MTTLVRGVAASAVRSAQAEKSHLISSPSSMRSTSVTLPRRAVVMTESGNNPAALKLLLLLLAVLVRPGLV